MAGMNEETQHDTTKTAELVRQIREAADQLEEMSRAAAEAIETTYRGDKLKQSSDQPGGDAYSINSGLRGALKTLLRARDHLKLVHLVLGDPREPRPDGRTATGRFVGTNESS